MTPMPRKLLIKYLDIYGAWDFEQTKQALQRVLWEGRWVEYTFDEVCRQASAQLGDNALYALKFKALVSAMKQRGMGDVYEYIMKQPIEEAFV